MKNFLLILLTTALASCITRAPSEYELDRRAGLAPSVGVPISDGEIAQLEKISQKKSASSEPIRSAPRIERIWVFDQTLGKDFWIKGTYIYAEVEPAIWSLNGDGGQD